MVDSRHLEILRKGVEVWNEWRQSNEDVEIDFERAYLVGADLRDANLADVNLQEADLRGANLQGVNLELANLEGANLELANLKEANLEFAHLKGANLEVAHLKGANLEEAYLYKTNLKGANLKEANLLEIYLEGANLVGVNLENANLKGANLENANLEGAYLYQVNLENANLKAVKALDANFQAAILTGACVENWQINLETNLNEVRCDYIFLKSAWSEEEDEIIFDDRRPQAEHLCFQPGEFEQLFEKDQKIFDLSIATNEINPQANQSDYTQDLTEAAAEIQKLLEQLEAFYPSDTMSGKMQIATGAISKIENNPDLMARIIRTLKVVGVSALEEFLNHPASSFMIPALEDWQKMKDS